MEGNIKIFLAVIALQYFSVLAMPIFEKVLDFEKSYSCLLVKNQSNQSSNFPALPNDKTKPTNPFNRATNDAFRFIPTGSNTLSAAYIKTTVPIKGNFQLYQNPQYFRSGKQSWLTT